MYHHHSSSSHCKIQLIILFTICFSLSLSVMSCLSVTLSVIYYFIWNGHVHSYCALFRNGNVHLYYSFGTVTSTFVIHSERKRPHLLFIRSGYAHYLFAIGSVSQWYICLVHSSYISHVVDCSYVRVFALYSVNWPFIGFP